MMTDWAAGVETRNYMIPRRTDSRNLADLLASMLCILVVAGALVGYLWIRNQIISLGYAIQYEEEKERSLMRIQTDLILEEETVKQPQLFDSYARNELAMQPLQPSQLIPSPGLIGGDRPASLALADTQQASVPPRRPSANN